MENVTEVIKKIDSLRNLDTLNADLVRLEDEVSQIYDTLNIASDDKELTVLALRREILKSENARKEMKGEREAALGLEFVSDEDRKAIMDVVNARQYVAEPFLRAYDLEVKANRILRVARQKLRGPALDSSKELKSEVSALRRQYHELFFALPDLGMTFEQWGSMDENERRKLRPSGRPPMPLECRYIQNKVVSDQLLKRLSFKSKGKYSTVEQAIDGVTLSNRGRPSITPLGKLDRNLTDLRRMLSQAMTMPEPEMPEKPRPGRQPLTRAKRIKGLLAKISDVEAKIAAEESQLEGVDLLRRQLEVMRAKHREMVMLESITSGKEQADLLLAILTNESNQIEMIKAIYELDPDATETPTHQVNPRATRDRINRLHINGRLKDSERQILEALEEKMFNTKVVRAR